jgi:hypothetical protein
MIGRFAYHDRDGIVLDPLVSTNGGTGRNVLQSRLGIRHSSYTGKMRTTKSTREGAPNWPTGEGASLG